MEGGGGSEAPSALEEKNLVTLFEKIPRARFVDPRTGVAKEGHCSQSEVQLRGDEDPPLSDGMGIPVSDGMREARRADLAGQRRGFVG